MPIGGLCLQSCGQHCKGFVSLSTPQLFPSTSSAVPSAHIISLYLLSHLCHVSSLTIQGLQGLSQNLFIFFIHFQDERVYVKNAYKLLTVLLVWLYFLFRYISLVSQHLFWPTCIISISISSPLMFFEWHVYVTISSNNTPIIVATFPSVYLVQYCSWMHRKCWNFLSQILHIQSIASTTFYISPGKWLGVKW